MVKTFFVLSLFIFFFLASTTKEASSAQKVYIHSAEKITPKVDQKRDLRITILKEYLKKQNSPLQDDAETLVKEADKNNLDWRLVAAISGVESTFAQELPYNSYNAWGWGIYGDNMIHFKSYKEGIEIISKSLRDQYINKWGAKDVYQIGSFYAASKTWAQRVNMFMGRIEEFAMNNPEYSISISL